MGVFAPRLWQQLQIFFFLCLECIYGLCQFLEDVMFFSYFKRGCIPEIQQVTLAKSILDIYWKFRNLKFLRPLRTSLWRGDGQYLCAFLAASVTPKFRLCCDWYKLNHRDDFDCWFLGELRNICEVTQFVVKFRIMVSSGEVVLCLKSIFEPANQVVKCVWSCSHYHLS